MSIKDDLVREIEEVTFIRNLIKELNKLKSGMHYQVMLAKAMLDVPRNNMVRVINIKVDMSDIGLKEPISLFQFICISGDCHTTKYLFERGGNPLDKYMNKHLHLIIREIAIINNDRDLGVLSIKIEAKRKRMIKFIWGLFAIALLFVGGLIYIVL